MKATARPTDYALLSEEEPYNVLFDRYEGPIDSTMPVKPGQEQGTYYKFFCKVVKPGDEEDGYEVSDTYSADADGNLFWGKKLRAFAEGFLGREVPTDEEVDFDDLIGAKARVMMGVKETAQGGRFSRIEKFLKKSTAQNGRR